MTVLSHGHSTLAAMPDTPLPERREDLRSLGYGKNSSGRYGLARRGHGRAQSSLTEGPARWRSTDGSGDHCNLPLMRSGLPSAAPPTGYRRACGYGYAIGLKSRWLMGDFARLCKVLAGNVLPPGPIPR